MPAVTVGLEGGGGAGWLQLELTNALTNNESLFYNCLSNFFLK